MSTVPESKVTCKLTSRASQDAPKQYTITISGVTDALGNLRRLTTTGADLVAAQFAHVAQGVWSLKGSITYLNRQKKICCTNYTIADEYTCEPNGDADDTASVTRVYRLFPKRIGERIGGYILSDSGMGEGPAKVMPKMNGELADEVYFLRIENVKPDTDVTDTPSINTPSANDLLDVIIDVHTNPTKPTFTLKGPSSLIDYDPDVDPSSEAGVRAVQSGIRAAQCAMQTALDWGLNPKKGNFPLSEDARKEVTRRTALMLSRAHSGDWERQLDGITTKYPNWNFVYQTPSGAGVSTLG